MPIVGEVRKGCEIGKPYTRRYHQYIYHACQECGENSKYLHAHHIKEFAQYPELRFEVANGLTLCRGCHFRLHGLLSKRLMANACI